MKFMQMVAALKYPKPMTNTVKNEVLDQGSIYTSKRFQLGAKEKGIVTSMSSTGNCHDNAYYNDERIQEKLNYLSPEYRQQVS